MSDAGSAPDPRPVHWFVRRCRTRPWRTFLTIWGTLLLVVAACSVPTQWPSPIAPPSPTAIPYQELLPEIGRPLDALPTFDRQAAEYHHAWIDSMPDGTPRIVATSTAGSAQGGWPRQWWIALPARAWDVTDWTAPFAPAPHVFRLETALTADSVALRVPHAQGSRTLALQLSLPSALLPFTVPLLFAALAVVPTRRIALRIERRRGVRSACLHCGQLRDPARAETACPECGAPASAPTARHPGTRRRRLLLASIVLLPEIVLAGSLLHEAGRSTKSAAAFDAELASVAATLRERGLERIRSWTTSTSGRGWPTSIVELQERRWFSFTNAADPAPARTTDPFWIPDRNGTRLPLDFPFDGGHRTVLVTIHWALLVFELTLLHVLTLPLLYFAGRIR